MHYKNTLFLLEQSTKVYSLGMYPCYYLPHLFISLALPSYQFPLSQKTYPWETLLPSPL